MDSREMEAKLMEDIINKGSNAQLDYVEDLYSYLNLEEGDSTNASIDVTNVNEIIYIRLLVIKKYTSQYLLLIFYVLFLLVISF
jgi:hypothetical protein